MYIKELKGYKPMILLDDIFDKLDNKRVEQLIQLVAENAFGQVFITDTQQDRIEYLLNKISNNYRIFEVCNGTVNEIITL
jgi:DNA replication and repair protein RecF